MRKLIMILLLGMFMIGIVSAMEWDNVKNYNEETKEMIIENALGMGGDVAKIKLTSPLIVKVPQGYQKVAEFELTYYKDNNGGLDEIEFFDIRKSMLKIDRQFDFKIKTTQEVIVNDSQTTCEDNKTGNGKCITEVIGNHIEMKVIWQDLNYSNINKGEQITIGIFTDVQENDYVEWIPTFYGVEIDEWAVWTSSLNVDLIGYWKLDDNKLTTNVIDSFDNGINGTAVNNTENFSSSGIINNSFEFNGTLEQFVSINGIPSHINSNTTGTWAFWMFMDDTSTPGQKHMVMMSNSTGLAAFLRMNADGTIQGSFTDKWEFKTDDVLSSVVWHNIVLVQNGTSPILYIDNVSVDITFSVTTDVTAWFNDEEDFDLFAIGRVQTNSFTGDYYTGKIDELSIWSRPLSVSEINQLYNNGDGITILLGNTSLNSPADNFLSSINEVTFNATVSANIGETIVNMSLFTNESGNFEVKNTTNVTGTVNTTTWIRNLPSGQTYLWTVQSCNSNGDCRFAPNNRTITIVFVDVNNETHNANAFETDLEDFQINVTANASLTAITLDYNGTDHSLTNQGSGIWNVTINIPTGKVQNNTFKYDFTYGGGIINSINFFQNVNAITLGFCNSTLNVPYINFTFKNETTNEELVNATIDSTWNVWLGDGTISKQFTLTNSTENANYSMCFSASNDTANTNVTLVYNNVNSQQRIFVSEPILTNSTTLQTLFLLPSTLGLFGQFQTRDITNNPISLVKGVISRTLGSSIVNIASSFTDSSGIVIFFLNPDVLYTAIFSKTGFANNIFTFVPTTDLRFVTMGGTTSVNGSDISIGTLYQITPSNSTLTNNTLTTFGFNVTGTSNITFISMNITDGNGTSFSFDSNAGTGFISTILNTSENKTMVGIYEIQTPDENLTFSKIWIIGNEFEGDYSISKQGRLFLEYEFSDFIRLAFVILIMFGVVIFMSSNQLADNNESKIAVIVLLIWGFSAIGWLNNPATVSTTGIAQYARQYGIAILSTAGAVFFFIRRIFI